jgi:hypothetical protein
LFSTLTSASLKDLENNPKTNTNLKHIVQYFQSSCLSLALSMSKRTISTPTTATTFSYFQEKHHFPVPTSFGPLDPNLPLEEQHGGNFDLILHKLTKPSEMQIFAQ